MPVLDYRTLNVKLIVHFLLSFLKDITFILSYSLRRKLAQSRSIPLGCFHELRVISFRNSRQGVISCYNVRFYAVVYLAQSNWT